LFDINYTAWFKLKKRLLVMNKPGGRPQIIIRRDNFDLDYGKYWGTEIGKGVSERLNQKVHPIKETDLSYRLINHWEKIGLIDNERPSGKGWRKFSVMDLIWLRVVSRLRTFGYPLDKIVEMKKGLVRQNKKTGQYRFTLFEVYVVMALVFRRSAVLLVFDNGSAEPTTLAHMKLTEDILGSGLDDHIHISINAILQDLYKDRELSPLSDTSVELDDVELELIVLLRTGNYDQIKIKQTDGRIELIECTESVDPTGRIIDLLQDGDFQDISIIQRDGKVVTVNRTVRKKPSRMVKNH